MYGSKFVSHWFVDSQQPGWSTGHHPAASTALWSIDI